MCVPSKASKVYHYDFGVEETKQAIRESIEKLGYGARDSFRHMQRPPPRNLTFPDAPVYTDYYDLYLTHSPIGGKAKRLAAYKAILDAKAAGLVRSAGVSN